MTMFRKRWAEWALMVVVCVCHGIALGARPKRLDVRTMADWSIVVAPSATESETYAADEFRDFLAQSTGHRLPIRRSG